MATKASIHGIFISTDTGCTLVKYVNDPELKSELLSSFISGLFLFGKESVGHIEEITIKGLDLEILVVYKHNLFLIALYTANMMKKNLYKEAEQVLDLFYNQYNEKISCWDGEVGCFKSFEDIIINQVESYFTQFSQVDPTANTGNESFWKRLLSRFN